LKVPAGTSAQTIVPTDGPWLVRAFTSATDEGMLLEFDPNTGDLKRRIDAGAVPATSIFYENDNAFYAYWWDKTQHSFILKGR
jgi:hypothetical protein